MKQHLNKKSAKQGFMLLSAFSALFFLLACDKESTIYRETLYIKHIYPCSYNGLYIADAVAEQFTMDDHDSVRTQITYKKRIDLPIDTAFIVYEWDWQWRHTDTITNWTDSTGRTYLTEQNHRSEQLRIINNYSSKVYAELLTIDSFPRQTRFDGLYRGNYIINSTSSTLNYGRVWGYVNPSHQIQFSTAGYGTYLHPGNITGGFSSDSTMSIACSGYWSVDFVGKPVYFNHDSLRAFFRIQNSPPAFSLNLDLIRQK